MREEKLDWLVEEILSLTPIELAELNRRLQDAGRGGLGGVREPLRPILPSGSATTTFDIEE